ncbi:MAG: hypothetical protein ABR568_05670 [Pyrinomonadaceae bacterium]
MKTSNSIMQEIAALTERREGLAVELEKANQTNETAQTELLATGSTKAIETAKNAHASARALQHAVTTLDETLTEKNRELEDAETYEKQEGLRQRIAELDVSMDAAFKQYREGRIQMHKAMEEIAPPTVEAFHQLSQQRKEYQELLRITNSGAKLLNWLDGVDELQPFGSLVDEALRFQGNIAGRPSRAEKKAKITERSMKEKERLRRLDEERAARQLEANKINESGWVTITADRNPQRAA